jgi:hypothetical protein
MWQPLFPVGINKLKFILPISFNYTGSNFHVFISRTITLHISVNACLCSSFFFDVVNGNKPR